jgi:ketosteroid isomerase-like protein
MWPRGMELSIAAPPGAILRRAMSQENVELVRQALEYWNRGDLDAASEFWDDDVVLRMAEGWPERVFYGKDEVRSFWKGYAETMGHDSVIEELTDAGGSVVLRTRAHVSGDQSGIEGDLVSTLVLTVRKGKAVLMEFFWDHQEALEAVGLRE